MSDDRNHHARRAGRGRHHIEHPAYQRHHFESVGQQFDATNFAMWLFLLTEVMFFGGLFTAYLIMRNWYYPAFVEASHQLNIGWGTANTGGADHLQLHHGHGRVERADAPQGRPAALPLCSPSSWASSSSASRASSITRSGKITTFPASATAFRTSPTRPPIPRCTTIYPDDKPLGYDMATKTEMYFFLYFAMTGMHALHMIIGIGILGFMIYGPRTMPTPPAT